MLSLVATLAFLAAGPAFGTQDDGPTIDVWYGAQQTFGKLGHPQRWINVLGNVSDSDGVATLAFTLNGGERRLLAVGPDQRRLLHDGDFNIEIDRGELRSGDNVVELFAADSDGATSSTRIDVAFVPDSEWPREYSIDWSTVSSVGDAVEILDGRWVIEDGGLRTDPAHVGYDRLVAIGDTTWDDYEITVPITIHGVDQSAFDTEISYAPAVAIDVRWLGHTDAPTVCPQPHCGWEPSGASNLFTWDPEGGGALHLFAAPIHYPWKTSATTDEIQLEIGRKTWFKARVETTPTGSLYSLKVWPDREPEPAAWSLQRMTTLTNLQRGAFLLKAHHVDVTFGVLSVIPLAEMSWARVSKVTSVLVRSPLLLFSVAAAGLALVRRRHAPRLARLVLVASVFLLAAVILDVWLELRLPDYLAGDGWNVRELTIASRVGEGVRSLLVAVGATALFAGVWRRKADVEDEAR